MMEKWKKCGCFLILVFLTDSAIVKSDEGKYKNCTVGNKTTLIETEDCRCVEEQSCNEGLIVPLWRPVRGYSTGEMYVRAFVYFFALLYLFLGVSVVADRFMAAIETITSQEKEIVVKRKTGEKVSITIRVWNETVSNLTLMALGSSAPEILLSIIEVCHKDFKAGDLGPNTIVGSAAFNLLIIIAICILAIPNDEIRRQRYLRVFLVTATWSIFAYIWLYLIISVFSVGVVEIWEAFLTFLFFPITVITAYVADKKLIDYRFLTKKYRRSAKSADGTILALKPDELQPCMLEKAIQEADDDESKTPNLTSKELKEYEETRRQFGEILKKLKAENPNADSQFLQREAEYRMMMKARKSRAFYRIQNGQKMSGGGNFIKKRLTKQREDSLKRKNSPKCVDLESAAPACKIYFNPPYYTVMENEGFVEVTVTCEGQLPDDSCLKVDYFTIDGTAQAESDYVAVSGCLVFLSTDVQRHKRIKVPIIDDDIFEEDEHFYVCLSNPRIEYDQTSPKNHSNLFIQRPELKIELTEPHMATIMILDDDHAGVFSFENKSYAVSESAGQIEVRVLRTSGARGKVLVPYKTVEGTATADKDYEPKDSYLEFDNEETEKTITIGIVNDEEYEKTETFYIQLEEPVWIEKMSDPSKIVEKYKKRQQRKLSNRTTSSTDSSVKNEHLILGDKTEVEILGKPHLGQYPKCAVKIIESTEFKGFVDQMMKKANLSLIVGTSSWREQFSEALSVNSSEETLDEKQESPPPKLLDYIGHYITLPWKLVGACCPPTSYYNGWLCFVASIILIGVFTAIIGDLANYFGCTIGLKDAVTAISFVAMGTSVPDLFASKVAAVQDKYADSSIGNVTGSNAVNVFLGIGVAWTLCALVSAFRNEPNGFQVDPGSLAFSVTIFCTEAFVAILLLLLRRNRFFGGGELGGPFWSKMSAAAFLVFLWLLYLVLSSLETYCIIKGF